MGWQDESIPAKKGTVDAPRDWMKDSIPVNKAPEPPGFLSQMGDMAVDAGKGALGYLATLGHKLDSYTGAPVRAMVGAAQDGKADPIAYGLNQFGDDPAKAPTGKQIVMKAGLNDTKHLSDLIPGAYIDRNKDTSFFDPRVQKGGMLDPSAADVGGLAMNVATDPTTWLTAGGGGIAQAGEALAATNAGSKLAGGLAQAGAKASSALSHVGPLAGGYGGGLLAETLGLPRRVGHVIGAAVTSPTVLNTAGRLANQAVKYAEPIGLGLDQLSHQGEPGMPSSLQDLVLKNPQIMSQMAPQLQGPLQSIMQKSDQPDSPSHYDPPKAPEPLDVSQKKYSSDG